jgi:hypothetical protein
MVWARLTDLVSLIFDVGPIKYSNLTCPIQLESWVANLLDLGCRMNDTNCLICACCPPVVDYRDSLSHVVDALLKML